MDTPFDLMSLTVNSQVSIRCDFDDNIYFSISSDTTPPCEENTPNSSENEFLIYSASSCGVYVMLDIYGNCGSVEIIDSAPMIRGHSSMKLISHAKRTSNSGSGLFGQLLRSNRTLLQSFKPPDSTAEKHEATFEREDKIDDSRSREALGNEQDQENEEADGELLNGLHLTL